MNRRLFIQLSGVSALSSVLPAAFATDASTGVFDITAEPGKANLVGPQFPATDVWTFNGQIPGSPIRVTRGQSVDATVQNALEVPTAVHWHGIRLPNAMDGVAGLTQPAIQPGKSFRYQFTPPDAGTFWYHSHVNAYEQIGRGLYGPLIIDEVSPPVVDRDIVWMIDDWRLLDDTSIRDDFGNGHDRSHAGRIGNVPTVNGRFRDIVKVQTGERIRLRLINASNARNFALSFGELNPSVIAIDGQAVTPLSANEPIIIGAAGRVDLILDMSGDPGAIMPVVDSFYRDSFELTKFVYDEKPLRESALQSAIALDPPQLPEPDLSKAIEHTVTIAGGAMGGLRRAKLDGEWMGLREIAQRGYVWAINDVVGNKLDMPPLIDTKQGTSIRLTIRNDTAFPHPMHLHGHHLKLLSIDSKSLPDARWVDSPLVMPEQTVELAFVADNPGDWLFHCHALEHHAAGLGSLVRIT
ncbi:MAG: multicopper oxidase family protein [Granulosicoccus sp.]|nr:multicopper oxidase family protein [Granulosicoccus sp.]